MNDTDLKKNESGFTLVELLIVAVVLVAILGIIGGVVGSIQGSYSNERVRTEALNDATAAFDMMTRLMRTAGNNPSGIAGLVPVDPGVAVGGVYRTIHLRSDWRGAASMSTFPDGDTNDPLEDITFFVQNNKLMKQEPADVNPVEYLTNVSSLQFNYFDTNNVAITNPAASTATIARVEIVMTMQSPGFTPMTFTSSAYVRLR
jgi:type II secretory pathway pseudopilin PulG